MAVRVRNDSPEPALSIADVTVAEDAGKATFTVTPDVVSGEAVTVDYATSDDTAEAGSDYTAAERHGVDRGGCGERHVRGDRDGRQHRRG